MISNMNLLRLGRGYYAMSCIYEIYTVLMISILFNSNFSGALNMNCKIVGTYIAVNCVET